MAEKSDSDKKFNRHKQNNNVGTIIAVFAGIIKKYRPNYENRTKLNLT